MKTRSALLLSILAVSFCFVTTSAPAQQVAVWGSTTCQKQFLEPGAEAFNKATGHTLSVAGVGTGQGMMALIEGQAKVAAASSSLESAIKSAKKNAKKSGAKIVIPDNLVFHQIAEDVIVPIVNKSNPVQNLTWEQLAKLNTGEITNWKEVGGLDMPVVVITSHAGSATRAMFQKSVMKKADYIGNAKKVKSTAKELEEVSKNPGAIGAVSEAFFKLKPGNCKVIDSDSIRRPLALITIGDPVPEVQVLIDFFLSPAGQEFVAK